MYRDYESLVPYPNMNQVAYQVELLGRFIKLEEMSEREEFIRKDLEKNLFGMI